MGELWGGLVRAVGLIISLDPEVMEITGRTLVISLLSLALSVAIALPLGGLIHFNRFPGKRMLLNVIQTLFSLPTVIVGLLVIVFFSRAGILGGLGLMFTPTLMVVGQTLLVTPLILGLVIAALSSEDKALAETAFSLGASRFQSVLLTYREARYAVLAAVIMGFGRAISEVGLALMVGGNIRGFTRTITTAISLGTSQGDIEFSLALGIILLLIALVINVVLNRLQQR